MKEGVREDFLEKTTFSQGPEHLARLSQVGREEVGRGMGVRKWEKEAVKDSWVGRRKQKPNKIIYTEFGVRPGDLQ